MKLSRQLAAAGLSGLVVMTGLVTVTAAPAQAATSIPPWEDTVANGGDPNHTGSLTLFDANGLQITSGNLADLPFLGKGATGYVEASVTLRSGDTKATLYGATPTSGTTPDKWCTGGMSASTFYPTTTGPTNINSATTPVVTVAGSDGDLNGYTQKCPSGSPYTGYANVYQLRVRTTAPGVTVTNNYATADLQIDTTAKTWTQIYPAPPPPTAPDAPASVTATPGPGSLDVSWAAPNNHGAAISSYTVTATPNPAVSGFSAVTATVSTTTAHLTHLAGGAPYDIQVTATNSAGTSAASTKIQGTPQAPIVPGAPLNLSATAGNGTISLAWVTPDDGGAPLSNYSLTYNVHGSSTVTTVTPAPGPAATSAVISGVPNGAQYDVKLVAHNSVGASSPATATATLAARVPGAPTGVTATAGDGTAVVYFTAPSATGGASITSYTVHASTGETVTGSASPLTIAVANGTSRTFTVTATNSAGAGPASAASNAVAYYSSALTIHPSVGTVVAGTVVKLAGQFTSGPASAQQLQLFSYPAGHPATVTTVTTTATGAWMVYVKPLYSTTYRVLYAGDATHSSAASALTRVLVKAKVAITSPRQGTRTSARKLVVTGATYPNKAGAVVYLYEFHGARAVKIATARVARNGTFRFVRTFGRGTHVLMAVVAATSTNTAGASARVTLREI